MKWLFSVLALLLASCEHESKSTKKPVDLDQPNEMKPPGASATSEEYLVVERFEKGLMPLKRDSVDLLLEVARAYSLIGNATKTIDLYYRIRQLHEGKKRSGSEAIFLASLYCSSVYFERQKWDTSWLFLDIADSFVVKNKGMSEWDKFNIFRGRRAMILERQGKTDQILQLWKNQCAGSGEDVLARSLRKKFGKMRVKIDLESALNHPVVLPAAVKWDGRIRIEDPYTVLPDGDRVPGRDFGGLFVRLDLPEKSCYLWAPPDEDSIFNVHAYLNAFRETRFCKILQDIDPDAREVTTR